jgi:hypothetical protein
VHAEQGGVLLELLGCLPCHPVHGAKPSEFLFRLRFSDDQQKLCMLEHCGIQRA